MAWARAKTAVLVITAAVPLICAPLAISHFTTDKATEVATFSSFGPGQGYDPSLSWGLDGNYTNPSGQAQFRGHAEWFNPATSGRLSKIELAIQRLDEGRLNIFVAKDADGFPEQILERFRKVLAPAAYDKARASKLLKSNGHQPKALPPGNPETPRLVLHSIVRASLEAGAKYWVCVEPADQNTASFWFNTNGRITNSFAIDYSPWSWTIIEANRMAPNASTNFTFKSRGHRNGAFSVSVKAIQPPTQEGHSPH
jgi:hypothetical protein